MSRSIARETAFKVLFQVDLAGASPDESFDYLMEENPLPERHRLFARELINQTLAHLEPIDRSIGKYSPEWSIQRMAAVDRNLMRVAASEMLYIGTDAAVVINEAVELAKKYGDENSGGFINAILDKIAGEKSEIGSGN